MSRVNRWLQGGYGGFGLYSSRSSGAFAAVSLALYDIARSSVNPEATLQVVSGTVPLLTHTFTSSGSATGVYQRLANAVSYAETAYCCLQLWGSRGMFLR